MMKQKCEAEGLGEGFPRLCVFVGEGVAEAELEAVAVRVAAVCEGEGDAEGDAADEPASGEPATEA
jgi:hypothetical protein